jgi:hypothetical protein
MNDLLVELRDHDLPPRWDGLACVWDGWETVTPAIICPPPKTSGCEGCGSAAPAVMNRGRVARIPAVTHASIRETDKARERLPLHVRYRLPMKADYRLTAFRCPDCLLDVVWDQTTAECWTLDHTDYGHEGSVAP